MCGLYIASALVKLLNILSGWIFKVQFYNLEQ